MLTQVGGIDSITKRSHVDQHQTERGEPHGSWSENRCCRRGQRAFMPADHPPRTRHKRHARADRPSEIQERNQPKDEQPDQCAGGGRIPAIHNMAASRCRLCRYGAWRSLGWLIVRVRFHDAARILSCPPSRIYETRFLYCPQFRLDSLPFRLDVHRLSGNMVLANCSVSVPACTGAAPWGGVRQVSRSTESDRASPGTRIPGIRLRVPELREQRQDQPPQPLKALFTA